MRFRFSLRAALVAMTAVALLAFWRDRPRRIARQFQHAVQQADYSAADALITNKHERFVAAWMADPRHSIEVNYRPPTFAAWLEGRHPINVGMKSTRRPNVVSIPFMESTASGIARDQRLVDKLQLMGDRYARSVFLHEGPRLPTAKRPTID